MEMDRFGNPVKPGNTLNDGANNPLLRGVQGKFEVIPAYGDFPESKGPFVPDWETLTGQEGNALTNALRQQTMQQFEGTSNQGGFLGQLKDFVTSPNFLLAAGPTLANLAAAGPAGAAGTSSSLYGGAGADTLGTAFDPGSGLSGLQTAVPGYVPPTGMLEDFVRVGVSQPPPPIPGPNPWLVGGGAALGGAALTSGLGGSGSNFGTGDGITEPSNPALNPGVPPPSPSTAGVSSALSRILDGTATTADWLSVGGSAGAGLLGAYGSSQQADQLGRIADQQAAQHAESVAMGAPYRGRLADLYANPTGFLTSPEVQVPVQQGTDALARSLSIKGNPAGSGNALQQLQSYSSDQLFGKLGSEKDRLAGYGGLTAYNNQGAQPAPTDAAAAQLRSQGNVFSTLGNAAGNIFNPATSLDQLMRQLRGTA